MNELLRLLRKAVRPFGYDVRKKQAYNLLRVKGLERLPALRTPLAVFDREAGPDPDVTLDRVRICIRTCLGEARDLRRHVDLTGVPLEEHMLRCLLSTVASVNEAVAAAPGADIEVRIFDDHSDAGSRARLERLFAGLDCPWTLRTTAGTGQGASLIEQFEYARGENAVIYFCEDDYLHEASAIREMWNFYRQVHQASGTHLLIHPQEGESLFNNAYYPSYILLGEARRWRTMSHATHVFMTHGRVVEEYWRYFENTRFVGDPKKRRLGSESRTTNRLFEHIPGFCPLPAVAAHMQAEGLLPPFFDWRGLWAQYPLPESLRLP